MVVLSYGLYAPGSPTSFSITSFFLSDFDLKAAEPASCSLVLLGRCESYAPGPGTRPIRSLRARMRASSMAARFAGDMWIALVEDCPGAKFIDTGMVLWVQKPAERATQ